MINNVTSQTTPAPALVQGVIRDAVIKNAADGHPYLDVTVDLSSSGAWGSTMPFKYYYGKSTKARGYLKQLLSRLGIETANYEEFLEKYRQLIGRPVLVNLTPEGNYIWGLDKSQESPVPEKTLDEVEW